MEELDDTTTCPVCFEKFSGNENSIPRLLPCTHSVCGSCIAEIIRNNSLVCPVCRKKHIAGSGVNTFAQNKYILKAMVSYSKENTGFKICKTHKRELSLFCKDDICNKPICQLCLLEDHKSHDVQDILKEKEVITEKANILADHLSNYEDTLLSAKETLEQKFQESKLEIEMMKHTLNKKLDAHLNRISSHKNSALKDIRDKLESIKDGKKKVKMIVEKQTSNTDLKGEIDSLDAIEHNIVVENAKAFSLMEYTKSELNEVQMTELLGDTIIKDLNLKLPWQTIPKKFKIHDVSRMCVLPDGNIVICGQEGKERKRLTKFNPDGEILESVTLDKLPNDITQVTAQDEPCVALSYRKEQMIVFRLANQLTEITLKYYAAPREPSYLSVSQGSTLVYVDESMSPRIVRWLDCSQSPCRYLEDVPSTKLVKPMRKHPDKDGWIPLEKLSTEVGGIACMPNGNDQYLVVLAKPGGAYGRLRAYSRNTGNFMWQSHQYNTNSQRIFLSLECPIIDGQKQIFAINYPSNLVKFNTEGRYLGTVLRIDSAVCIQYHKKSSSVVVADRAGSIFFVRV